MSNYQWHEQAWRPPKQRDSSSIMLLAFQLKCCQVPSNFHVLNEMFSSSFWAIEWLYFSASLTDGVAMWLNQINVSWVKITCTIYRHIPKISPTHAPPPVFLLPAVWNGDDSKQSWKPHVKMADCWSAWFPGQLHREGSPDTPALIKKQQGI